MTYNESNTLGLDYLLQVNECQDVFSVTEPNEHTHRDHREGSNALTTEMDLEDSNHIFYKPKYSDNYEVLHHLDSHLLNQIDFDNILENTCNIENIING